MALANKQALQALEMRVMEEVVNDSSATDTWFTPAFWTTVATALGNLVTVAVLFGWIDSANSDSLTQAIAALVGAAQVIVVNTVLIWRYVVARKEVEVAKIQARTAYIQAMCTRPDQR